MVPPLAYIIHISDATELLDCRLRRMGLQHGLQITGHLHAVSLYADDILVYLKDIRIGLRPLLDILHTFGQISGLRTNITKSCIFPLSEASAEILTDRDTTPLPLASQTFKYHGVNVYRTPEVVREDKLGRAITSLRSSVTFWKRLHLCLMGDWL